VTVFALCPLSFRKYTIKKVVQHKDLTILKKIKQNPGNITGLRTSTLASQKAAAWTYLRTHVPPACYVITALGDIIRQDLIN